MTHKVFISYHHADQKEVDDFISKFDDDKNILISRALGMADDIINSTDSDYIMRRIRQLYLEDSTVTIVLMGKCTWARRYIDWEIQASLRNGETVTPNGLLGIKLKSFDQYYPERLNNNLKGKDDVECYARVINYPSDAAELEKWIEDAFNARTTRARYIKNPRAHFEYNRSCE
jgi:hypothetical protein